MTMRPSRGPNLTLRRRVLLGVWLVAGVVLLARAGQIQIFQADKWRSMADRQQRSSETVPAPRGAVLDRDGVQLAVSHETFTVGVAPREILDRDAAVRALVDVLDLTSREARRLTDPARRWAPVRGRFSAEVREALSVVQGVYVTRELDRFYPHEAVARGVLGRVTDGVGAGGVDQEFDAMLQGVDGRTVLARDSRGRRLPGQSWIVEEPQSGGQVVLTIDLELQEIAEEALAEAIDDTQARGGTVLVTDPRTGEIMAMASVRDGSAKSLAAINTPYEPGSTLKPFTVAALLEHEIATLADSVDTGNGYWQVAGRALRDVHASGKITLADALRESSNVGIAKIAQGLTPAQQFESLRDLGFGMATGLRLPGEASGVLRYPEDWSSQSPASLAIGYEVSVTPLQMAMAYGALANGGYLMEPRIIKETRDGNGRVVERFEPRAVRKVFDGWLTRTINNVLVDVVEDGTGTAARLANFDVAGKSGTSRVSGADGRYVKGAYFSSFVGFFPAEDPQLVVFVLLEQPQGKEYYGGAIAAPVTRATLEAILAARRPPLDRNALAHLATAPKRSGSLRPVDAPRAGGPAPVRFATLSLGGPSSSPSREGGSARTMETVRASQALPLADLSGLSLREAVRRLHARGLRVTWDGGDRVKSSLPRWGTPVAAGDTVHLLVRRGDDG
jgi:cell division protein FtsI (penicillin-binding protein 3)